MKILALAGSNSPESINRQLVAHAADLSRHQATLIDMTAFDDTPIYSSLRQQRDGFPAEIKALYDQIKAHDGLLIASPEHNGSIPAVFKNVIDWLSRIEMKFLSEKPVLVMSTSPGPNGGRTNLAHLSSLLPWWGAQVTGSWGLGSYYAKMQPEGLEPESRAELQALVDAFDAAVAAKAQDQILTLAPVLQAA